MRGKPLGSLGRFGSRSVTSLVGLEKTPIPIEQQISDVLLANNANLLALICQASFVGDTAATVSLGVLSLLRRQKGGRGTEAFLKRLLRGRIEQYREYFIASFWGFCLSVNGVPVVFGICGRHVKKSRDLSDIIRDNRCVFLVSLSYLGQSLSDSLREILPYIDACEIDPQKLASSFPGLPASQDDTIAGSTQPTADDAQTTQRLLSHISENEARLKEATLVVLSSIVGKRELMP
ncbi:hypothetical protein HK104_002035, partial [Borealophlyctis nickersoniae]